MRLKNISLRLNIFLIIFIAIFIPTVTMSVIIYKRAEEAITNQTSRTVINSMDYMVGNIDSSLSVINQMSSLFLNDYSLKSIININQSVFYSSSAERYSEIWSLLNSFTFSMKNAYNLNEFDSFYLYMPKYETIINSKSTYFEGVKEDEIDYVKKNNTNSLKDQWFISDAFEYNTLGIKANRIVKDKFITYNKIINDDNNEIKAIVATNVNTNFVKDKLSKLQMGSIGDTIALDKDGNMISSADENNMEENLNRYIQINKKIGTMNEKTGSFFITQDNNKYFVIYYISEYTNWRYIQILPEVQILGQVMEIKQFLLTIILIATIVLIGLTYILTNIFYKPIETIISAMKEIENRNLDVRIDDKRTDEYGRIYRVFNDMTIELKCLIKDLTNEKLLKKEADIKLLQAQINPHFLYNTLESIYSIAKINKVEEISLMVAALSKFFRISLSGGKNIVTLKDAIDIVINYLTIQNIRFKGKITYKIEISQELMSCTVPKLILQPIVENAIFHGLERKKEGGILIICGKIVNNNLEITVEDNGLGITEDNLIKLREALVSESFEDSKNFALRNINRQIKLKYGNEYGIQINSTYGSGTCVIINLPVFFDEVM